MIEKESTKSKGGARPGAGRKPGVANRRTAEQAARASKTGITPLDYLLGVMRGQTNKPRDRLAAAVAAAPYVHSKLSAVALTGADGGDIKHAVRVTFG